MDCKSAPTGESVIDFLEAIKTTDNVLTTSNSLIFSKNIIDKVEAVYNIWSLIGSDKQVVEFLGRDNVDVISKQILNYKNLIADEVIY
ncbi:MAG: hypothetical protein JXR53_07200 [Bacteroidales bacterium]|nr:hypothetical protein [Bacteroidales bacterium]